MPFLFLGIGIYVNYILNKNGSIWLIWGIYIVVFSMVGHPEPLEDNINLDKGRLGVGIVTFALGALCFTLVPFTIVQ
ncbi:hypothetical protein SAMN06295989_102121 [Methanohalophilus euhalobius]|jgi:hypothetical protein|uniref:Uncharacterized protein n=1 Tax=Methanohalophilus euhalobius TaxID=51203 RepID=A0A285EXB7_9EURY|nr:hypothetical protein SAMN06295989_102121 [Methanohalophilus euhalobius]